MYYVILLTMWLISPALAYNFSELIEAHAVDTYAQFADQNKTALRQLPPPRIAKVGPCRYCSPRRRHAFQI